MLSIRLSIHPYPSILTVFSLISWKGNDENASNFADTLISIRCTFIIKSWGVGANSVQLVPQFSLKHSDTLHKQCRHTEHLHEEVWYHKNCLTKWQRFELSHYFNTLHGEINLYQSFYWSHLILCIHNVDTLNICLKKFDAINTFWQNVSVLNFLKISEPHHEKSCLCHMRTTKTQIRLRIRAVWSASLLFTA